MLLISQLFIYPIKSLAGIEVKNARVTDRGFEYDRRWVLIDKDNRFLTQREWAQMALFKVALTQGGLQVTYPTKSSSLLIPFEPLVRETVHVTIWDDKCTGQLVSPEADIWFSEMLGLQCQLVYMPDDTQRITDHNYAPADSIVSFADGYPFLLIGQASLDDLNIRLKEQLLMDRFRPNIVFTGGSPFQEDTMNDLIINGIHFHGVKLCARCIMITIDQETALKNKEPLKTLSGYRLKNNKILFGQNLVHKGSGELAVGDNIEILNIHTDDRFMV